MPGNDDRLRVAMIGYGFMGAVHTHAWHAVRRAFDLSVVPVLSVICGRDQAQLEAAASRFGFAETATDSREVSSSGTTSTSSMSAPQVTRTCQSQ